MALTRDKINEALDIFQTPVMFRNEAQMMLSQQEMEMILLMGGEKAYYVEELKELLAPISQFPQTLIDSAYCRAVLKKVRDEEGGLMYQVTSFYTRYPYFAQFEPLDYQRIPRDRRVMMNDWDYEVYASYYRDVIRLKKEDYDVIMHDTDFMTLEQAIDAIKDKEELYLVPCNCKYMMDVTDRPRDCCVHVGNHDNSEQDRGHGMRVTAEYMVQKLKEFRSRGLMQNGCPEHEGGGFCNCDGASCYPIRMCKELGSRGHAPRAYWTIHWDAEKCISCGKCAKICNFFAFTTDRDGKIAFHPDKCWGCTICVDNCPKGAITRTPIEWHLKPLEDANKAKEEHETAVAETYGI